MAVAACQILFCLVAFFLHSGVKAQSTGDLRLVGRNGVTSLSLTAGRLEAYYNGQWGTVCDDSFGATEARVACRQLGFSDYVYEGTIAGSRFHSCSSSTPIWLDDLSCSSSNTRLDDCSHNTIGSHNCDHLEDVYVSCLGTGALRIGTVDSSSSGRLEVYFNGQWGTVCNDFFFQSEADVACRQLGYSSASNYGTATSIGYSSGSGPIWLDNVDCSLSDIMLSSCSHNAIGSTDCSHSEDVGVICNSDIHYTDGSGGNPIRLVGRYGVTSSSLTAGRLEAYYNGQWGTVCDDSFGSTEAIVACRQLGFDGYVSYGTISTTSRFQTGSSCTPIWLDDLSCSNSFIQKLDDCSHNAIGSSNCNHNEDVFISCEGPGALRLGRFDDSASGLLEVYFSGEWGTVCDDSFFQTEADVACRQLGYSSATSYGTATSLGFSTGSGEIWLDEVDCTSSGIAMLSLCSHNTVGVTDCSHSDDVGVWCDTTSDITNLVSSISTGVIVAIVIAVLVPFIFIGVCIAIVCIAICTGACAAGASSRRNRNRGAAAATAVASTTAVPPTAVITTTGTAQAQAPYPPYGGPQAQAPYPPYGGGYPQAPPAYPDKGQPYPAQGVAPAPYPPNTAPAGYPPPDATQEKPPVELNQYPPDAAYPPATVP